MSTTDPSLDHTLPSSNPITPAPIIASFFGVSLNSRAPELPTTVDPFQGTDGIFIGLEPAAKIIFLPLTVCFFPFEFVTSTSLAETNFPFPCMDSTLLCLNR